MLRYKNLGTIVGLVIVSLFLLGSTSFGGQIPISLFNNGTSQGWKCDLVAEDPVYGEKLTPWPPPPYFLDPLWSDTVNYPDHGFPDPIDNRGSICFPPPILIPLDTVECPIIRFISPDLSNYELVQNMDGFSCQVMDTTADDNASNSYTNLFIMIEDVSTGEDRYICNGTAVKNIDKNVWIKHEFLNIKDTLEEDFGIRDYIVKRIVVCVWLVGQYEPDVGIYLDNVVPIPWYWPYIP